jgi:hypothetical protein
MSRFDELTLLFDPWRKNWLEQYRRHQLLPLWVAKQFQEFLGCPEFFREAGAKDAPVVKYVSPTQAKLNEDGTEQFTLIAYQNGVEDVEFQEDGYFYFGLRVYLEHGPDTYPKQPFWFLFRGKQEGGGFSIWEQRSQRKFTLDTDPPGDEFDALCEHLFKLLKDELAVSPILRVAKEPYRIGFTPQNS